MSLAYWQETGRNEASNAVRKRFGRRTEIAHARLCGGVRAGTQQRKAAPLTIDGVLARRERDVAATAAAALPDGEAGQLQAVELSVGEMQLGIREFAGRVAFVVRRDGDDDAHSVTS